MIRKGFILPVVLAILENESLAYILSLEQQIHIHTYVKAQSLTHYSKGTSDSLPNKCSPKLNI